jgi:hypothetical protein
MPPSESSVSAGDLVSVREAISSTNIDELLAELDRDLVGLRPVKKRIRQIAALLLIEKLRAGAGL